MRILLILCHPSRESYLASVADAVTARLREGGHQVQVTDLYAEGFDPVLDADAWRAHRQNRRHQPGPAIEIEALLEADGLVLVYPTWWYGMPAMLKGWFDRVWQPNVAFRVETGAFKIRELKRLRRFAAVMTYGSPRLFIEWIVGDPARRQLMRGLALQFAPGLKTCWAPIYSVDGRSQADLARARERTARKVARLFDQD